MAISVTEHNFVQDEIRSRLNLGNACYHSVQNILSTRLLSEKIKSKLYFACGSVWV
jgi:hypothetical protein